MASQNIPESFTQVQTDMYNLYRTNTLVGKALLESLCDMADSGDINNNLAFNILQQFDYQILKYIRLGRGTRDEPEDDRPSISFESSQLQSYRHYSSKDGNGQVWELLLKNVDVKLEYPANKVKSFVDYCKYERGDKPALTRYEMLKKNQKKEKKDNIEQKYKSMNSRLKHKDKISLERETDQKCKNPVTKSMTFSKHDKATTDKFEEVDEVRNIQDWLIDNIQASAKPLPPIATPLHTDRSPSPEIMEICTVERENRASSSPEITEIFPNGKTYFASHHKAGFKSPEIKEFFPNRISSNPSNRKKDPTLHTKTGLKYDPVKINASQKQYINKNTIQKLDVPELDRMKQKFKFGQNLDVPQLDGMLDLDEPGDFRHLAILEEESKASRSTKELYSKKDKATMGTKTISFTIESTVPSLRIYTYTPFHHRPIKRISESDLVMHNSWWCRPYIVDIHLNPRLEFVEFVRVEKTKENVKDQKEIKESAKSVQMLNDVLNVPKRFLFSNMYKTSCKDKQNDKYDPAAAAQKIGMFSGRGNEKSGAIAVKNSKREENAAGTSKTHEYNTRGSNNQLDGSSPSQAHDENKNLTRTKMVVNAIIQKHTSSNNQLNGPSSQPHAHDENKNLPQPNIAVNAFIPRHEGSNKQLVEPSQSQAHDINENLTRTNIVINAILQKPAANDTIEDFNGWNIDGPSSPSHGDDENKNLTRTNMASANESIDVEDFFSWELERPSLPHRHDENKNLSCTNMAAANETIEDFFGWEIDGPSSTSYKHDGNKNLTRTNMAVNAIIPRHAGPNNQLKGPSPSHADKNKNLTRTNMVVNTILQKRAANETIEDFRGWKGRDE